MLSSPSICPGVILLGPASVHRLPGYSGSRSVGGTLLIDGAWGIRVKPSTACLPSLVASRTYRPSEWRNIGRRVTWGVEIQRPCRSFPLRCLDRHRTAKRYRPHAPFPSLAKPDKRNARVCRTKLFLIGLVGQAEQGGGDDGREDDAARACDEGGVVAGVEDGQVAHRAADTRRVG